MQYEVNKSPGVTTVSLKGRMCFNDHAMFREVLREFNLPPGERVVFDMGGLEFIDSSGLGMLIIAREEVKKRKLELAIENTKAEVKRLMDMAKFERYFTIR